MINKSFLWWSKNKALLLKVSITLNPFYGFRKLLSNNPFYGVGKLEVLYFF
jgi:hypothetical protein